jgi:hypothetical protein
MASRLFAISVLLIVPACSRDTRLISLSTDSVQLVGTSGGPDPADQIVTLQGSRRIAIDPATWVATTDQPWLTILPSSGLLHPGQSLPLTIHAHHLPEAWTGSTSTLGAPSLGLGAWTGSAMFIWTGDPAVSGRFYDPVSDTWSGATSPVGAPSFRLQTPIVWTGKEIIVWGGITAQNGTPLNTGARYNPATDTWTPMSTVGAPAARNTHVVVWTGTRMIVWGGETPGYNYMNTGGIYDPETDTWTGATTLVNAPSPRGNLAAVWTGTRMLLWGGEDPSKFNTGYFYDPVLNAWTGSTTLTGAPAARSHLGGVWTGDEMIVWGGGSGGPHLNTGARYDPAKDAWSAPTTLIGAPAAKATFACVWTGSEMLVWGGESNGTLVNTGARYRPPTPSIGSHTATVTITPSQGDPVTLTVTFLVTP